MASPTTASNCSRFATAQIIPPCRMLRSSFSRQYHSGSISRQDAALCQRHRPAHLPTRCRMALGKS
eukprot:3398573-Prymnesium_polylepis.1